MENQSPEMNYEVSVIDFSNDAVDKLSSLIESEDNADILGIRIYVAGGGCSGVQWGMTFADSIKDDDIKQDVSSSLSVIMDPHCNATLKGVSIKFEGDNFVFDNPAPAGGCGGCGGGQQG